MAQKPPENPRGKMPAKLAALIGGGLVLLNGSPIGNAGSNPTTSTVEGTPDASKLYSKSGTPKLILKQLNDGYKLVAQHASHDSHSSHSSHDSHSSHSSHSSHDSHSSHSSHASGGFA
jgi:hypothetical protein